MAGNKTSLATAEGKDSPGRLRSEHNTDPRRHRGMLRMEGALNAVVLSLRKRKQRRTLGAYVENKEQRTMQVLLDVCLLAVESCKRAVSTRLLAYFMHTRSLGKVAAQTCHS